MRIPFCTSRYLGTQDKLFCVMEYSQNNWRFGYFPPSSSVPSRPQNSSNMPSTTTTPDELKGRRSWFDGDMADEDQFDGSGDNADSGSNMTHQQRGQEVDQERDVKEKILGNIQLMMMGHDETATPLPGMIWLRCFFAFFAPV